MIVVIDCIEYYRKYCLDIPVESKVRIQMVDFSLTFQVS